MTASPRPELLRTTIADVRVAVDFPLDALDLAFMRRAFSELFDTAAADVTRAGYDLDDVVVDRFLICRVPGGDKSAEVVATLPVTTLVDRVRLIEDTFEAFRQESGSQAPCDGVRVEELRAKATLERLA